MVDFRRDKHDVGRPRGRHPLRPPPQTPRLALLFTADGEKRLHPCACWIELGQTVVAGLRCPIETGNACPSRPFRTGFERSQRRHSTPAGVARMVRNARGQCPGMAKEALIYGRPQVAESATKAAGAQVDEGCGAATSSGKRGATPSEHTTQHQNLASESAGDRLSRWLGAAEIRRLGGHVGVPAVDEPL